MSAEAYYFIYAFLFMCKICGLQGLSEYGGACVSTDDCLTYDGTVICLNEICSCKLREDAVFELEPLGQCVGLVGGLCYPFPLPALGQLNCIQGAECAAGGGAIGQCVCLPDYISNDERRCVSNGITTEIAPTSHLTTEESITEESSFTSATTSDLTDAPTDPSTDSSTPYLTEPTTLKTTVYTTLEPIESTTLAPIDSTTLAPIDSTTLAPTEETSLGDTTILPSESTYGTSEFPPWEFVCPEPNGNFADPHDCSKFYVCEDDLIIAHMSCPQDLYFNPVISNCDYIWNVDCPEKTNTRIVGLQVR